MKTKTVQITLSQAISGYMLNIEGRRLSQNTINDYTNTLKKFAAYFTGNPLIKDIDPEKISAFLAAQPVSKKTASNYHACLSSMWRWLARQNLTPENIIQKVDRPKPEKRVIVPLEEKEIKELLNCLEKSRSYARKGKVTSDHTLPNIDRNRAIILFFMDNGVRVTELCNIKFKDLDVKNNRCFIFGKGSKERYVPFSARTGQALWHYITTLREGILPDDYLFVSRENRQLTRRNVEGMLKVIAARAGVSDVHPHRLRHTFAICYLRAGGDPFTLQAILGHEDSEMTQHYVSLANTDISRVHRRASPVEFMRL